MHLVGITMPIPILIPTLMQLVKILATSLEELPERRDRLNSKLLSKDSTSGESQR